MNEEIEWKDIKGYEGRYQISSDGKVKNVLKNKILKGTIFAGSEVSYIFTYISLPKMPISVVLLKFGKRIRDLIWSGFARPNRRIFRYVGERKPLRKSK